MSGMTLFSISVIREGHIISLKLPGFNTGKNMYIDFHEKFGYNTNIHYIPACTEKSGTYTVECRNSSPRYFYLPFSTKPKKIAALNVWPESLTKFLHSMC